MSEPSVSRRTVLEGLATGLAATVGVAPATASETPSVAEQLATVRGATAKYTDPKAALADGFQPSGPYVPGMGWHFIHQKRLASAAENGPKLTEPPILTYFDTGNRLVLGSAEFGLPLPNPAGYTRENPPDLFDDDTSGGDESGGDGGGHDHSGHEPGGESGDTETWHVHGTAQHLYASGNGQQDDPSSITASDLLTRGRWTELPGESGVTPGDEVTADWGLTGETSTRVVDLAPKPHPDLLSLHAWVHVENPRGPFAASNPAARFVERLPPELYPEETLEPQG